MAYRMLPRTASDGTVRSGAWLPPSCKIRSRDRNQTRRSAGGAPYAAFTLVELLTVIAIVGVLMSLLLTGIQATRDMARKTACANNLHQQLLAVHEFVGAYQYFPAGRKFAPTHEYSWCVESLPYLEQAALYARFDRNKPWSDASGNSAVSQTNLRIFRCPSAITKFDGKTDYGGIMGSTITVSPGFDFENGVMIEVGRTRQTFLTQAEIVDGLSQTIALAEYS